jgi:hypothetical protein
VSAKYEIKFVNISLSFVVNPQIDYLCLIFKMVKQLIALIIGIALGFPATISAQEEMVIPTQEEATLPVQDEAFIYVQDTLVANQDSVAAHKFVPNPTKAVLYSAIFPGLGQIYNRKYWKLPIVYGGYLGCVYAITWNGTQFNGYKNAYRDITDKNNETNSWINYLPYGTDVSNWSTNELNNFANRLKNGKDNFRRYRDLSVIITIGLYALTMVDAYVDAQLFEFDVSDDLSFRMEPVIFNRTVATSRAFGLQCSITF